MLPPSDAFLPGALNASGRDLYRALLAAPGLTAAEVAIAAGYSASTGRTMLRRMARAGVAARVGRGWFADPSPDWDAVARRCQTAGRLAQRATRHREAREAHRAYLQQRDERTARINALCDPATRTASFGAPPADRDSFRLTDIGPAQVDLGTGEVLGGAGLPPVAEAPCSAVDPATQAVLPADPAGARGGPVGSGVVAFGPDAAEPGGLDAEPGGLDAEPEVLIDVDEHELQAIIRAASAPTENEWGAELLGWWEEMCAEEAAASGLC